MRAIIVRLVPFTFTDIAHYFWQPRKAALHHRFFAPAAFQRENTRKRASSGAIATRFQAIPELGGNETRRNVGRSYLARALIPCLQRVYRAEKPLRCICHRACLHGERQYLLAGTALPSLSKRRPLEGPSVRGASPRCPRVETVTQPASPNSGSGRFVWIHLGLRWISLVSKRPGPRLANLCGTPAGPKRISPASASIFRSPIV